METLWLSGGPGGLANRIQLMLPRPTAPLHRLTQQDPRTLVCPVCHATLQLEGQAILCTGCNRRYSVVDGIPVLLTERSI
jgi:hypothetical protein